MLTVTTNSCTSDVSRLNCTLCYQAGGHLTPILYPSPLNYLTRHSRKTKTESKLHYNRRSVGQSISVSGIHLGPATNSFTSLNYLYTVADFLMWGAFSEERSGLYLRVAARLRQRSPSSVFVSVSRSKEREREREESWGVVVRDTTVWRGV
jgi:hypothetical protein